ncbi:acyl-CoA dehydrogenase [Pseudomonas costantinii]|uniref:acyl-CoA dehydrogenase n=1 Tax=Pseudomonas costantinii TaxID=168469 RepID=UPI0015A25F65|nr:acyl-CoA dehydrogenase [Pseudomonas costantinii]NVZ18761.1 acyl-CoA dehydrogenase [Pseudomonas costantinii]
MNDMSCLSAHRSSFKLDERDIHFQLFEVLRIQENVLQSKAFAHVDRVVCEQVIDAATKFARDYLGRSYQLADKEGCTRVSAVQVSAPPVYKKVWEAYTHAGLCALSAPPELGGTGTPYVLNQAVYGILYGADPAFCVYPGFNVGAIYLLLKHGTDLQQHQFCQALATPTMTASMVMTEPDAGSDVGAIRTRAIPMENGLYRIEGGKVFISSGMHDLTDNIVYFVLARVEGAVAGTRGLSCFVVTRYRLNEDGTPGEYNHVACDAVEGKMGLKGNATVQLSFGAEGHCYGTLLGQSEGMGLSQLMLLMNLARVATGTYAMGIASSAYYNAVEYARERIQGSSVRAVMAVPSNRLPIIEHMDVRRMLMDMKARVEGMRALVLKAAHYSSLAAAMRDAEGESKVLRKRYEALADLLTPVVKAWCSDQAWRVCETAIQVHGGYGYTSAFPVEQYCRDVKIMSIWEGTNYVQSADLIRSKLAMGKASKAFNGLRDEIRMVLDRRDSYPQFNDQFDALERALTVVANTLATFGAWLSAGHIEQIYLMATRFMGAFGDMLVGWLLLENALAAQAGLDDSPSATDADFYQGKLYAMRFFFRYEIAILDAKLNAISLVDDDFTQIQSAHFPVGR